MTEPNLPPTPDPLASSFSHRSAAEIGTVGTPPPTIEQSPSGERRSRIIGARRAFRAIKVAHASDLSPLERIADRLTGFAGSTPFLALHVVWFASWIGWNSLHVGQRIFGLPAFDPFPFGLLTMVVSLEAIFLSIFVLLSQRRESAIADLREELTLQVNLRIEEEVTKTLQLVAGLYRRMGHELAQDPELREMLQPFDPQKIEEALVEQIRGQAAARREAVRQRKAALRKP